MKFSFRQISSKEFLAENQQKIGRNFFAQNLAKWKFYYVKWVWGLNFMKQFFFVTKKLLLSYILKRVWHYLNHKNRNDKISYWKSFRFFGPAWCQKSSKKCSMTFGHQQLTCVQFEKISGFLALPGQEMKICYKMAKNIVRVMKIHI